MPILIVTVGVVNAANQSPMPPKIDPVCKPVMERMRSSHQQIEQLIKKNDATGIGNIIIADHKYMESFVAEYPQCTPPHNFMHSSASSPH